MVHDFRFPVINKISEPFENFGSYKILEILVNIEPIESLASTWIVYTGSHESNVNFIVCHGSEVIFIEFHVWIIYIRYWGSYL